MKPYNHAEEVKFKQHFGLELKDCWEAMDFLGLDVIKFDQHLKTPDGISTYDYIVKTVSVEAADFVP